MTADPVAPTILNLPGAVLARLRLRGQLAPAEAAAADLADSEGKIKGYWKPAIDLLAQPGFEVIVETDTTDGPQRLIAYGGAAGGGSLVSLLEAADGTATIGWPLGVEDVLAVAAAALGLEGRADPSGVRLDLSVEAVLVLAGFLDGLREAELDCLIQRQPSPAAVIGKAAVRLATTTGLASADTRWLLPALRRLLPAVPALGGSAFDHALEELAGAAILVAQDEALAMVPDFEPVRRLLLAPLATAGVTVAAGPGAPPHWSRLGGLRTLAALWGIEMVGDRVRIGTISEVTLLEGFRQQIAGEIAALAPAAAGAPSETLFCHACGGKVLKTQAYCAACGARLIPTS